MSRIISYVGKERSWNLYEEITYKGRKSQRRFYIKEFYSEKEINVSKNMGDKLDKLTSNKIRLSSKLEDCEAEIEKILRKIIKRKKK